MSNQFSYELDERQIRLMLQDGELEYDQSAWSRFEQVQQPDLKSSSSFSPKLNLSISRSVIVPAFFIILIGALSATLFSFVDFKKKDEVKQQPVTESKPESSSLKTPVTPTPVIKKETIATASVTSPAHQKTVASTTPSTITATTGKKAEKVIVTKPETKPVITTAKDNNFTLATDQKKETTPVAPVIRRKPKKVVSEEIPTINTSSTMLNSTSEEPELELK